MLQYVLPPIVMSLLTLILRYRWLQRREGNIPVRVLPAGRKRWSRGHAVWVHDVFAFRPAPAAWRVSLLWVTDILRRSPTSEERHQLRRLGHDLVVGTLRLNDDVSVQVATRREHEAALFGNPAMPQPLTPAKVIET